MKVPFGTALGPFFKVHHQQINKICKPCLFGSQMYLTGFSIAALVISIFDLMCILGTGNSPPSVLKSINPRVCPTLLRSSKLIGMGVNLCCYFLLVIGVYYKYPVFLMLYLAVNFVTILLYFLLLMIALPSNWQCVDKKNIFLMTFMLHNWLQVFCFFRSCLRIADF